MSQIFKPKKDQFTNLFLNDLGVASPLWSSIDEGLTSPIDAEFIEIDPLVGTFGPNVTVSAFANFDTEIPRFNTEKISVIRAKVRINTNGFDGSLSVRLFDYNYINLIASNRTVINTGSLTDFVLEMKVNTTNKLNWDLSRAQISISLGNSGTSTDASDLVGMKITVFEVEVVTITDCIVERIPQADAQFFIPTTWENELNVNHLLWESVATSGDAEFVKSLSPDASGGILFHYQGVGDIPESGLFQYRARNNGVDDSNIDLVTLSDYSAELDGYHIVASGLTDQALDGDFTNYEVPITFLSDFSPNSAYRLSTEISATGVLGIADTEISTQSLTLYMSNSYCCIAHGKFISEAKHPLAEITDLLVQTHMGIFFNESLGLVRQLDFDPTDIDADNETIINNPSQLPIGTQRAWSTGAPPNNKPNTPDSGAYIQLESFGVRPDTIKVEWRIRTNNTRDTEAIYYAQLLTSRIDTTKGINALPDSVCLQSSIPVSLTFDTGLGSISEYMNLSTIFDLTDLTDDEFDHLNRAPLLRFTAAVTAVLITV